jgi:hypothetical protein
MIADTGSDVSAALHRRLGFTDAGRWVDPLLMQRDLPVIATPTRHRQQRLNPHPRPIRQLTPTNHNQEAAGRPAQRRTR